MNNQRKEGLVAQQPGTAMMEFQQSSSSHTHSAQHYWEGSGPGGAKETLHQTEEGRKPQGELLQKGQVILFQET